MAFTDDPELYNYAFLNGGGEMGALIRRFDWAATSLGDPGSWPDTLRSMTATMLSTPSPLLICWGPDHVQLYNDAFRPINGATKHPQALGGSARDTYAEIWPIIGPLFAGVMQGQAVDLTDMLAPLDRNGYVEDCYFDFSYSPIKDIDGDIGGILVICTETTEKVRSLKNLEHKNSELQFAAQNETLAQKKVQENERNLRLIIMQAPVAIAIFRGPEYVVEIVNPLAIRLWGRSHDEVINRPILKAMPELVAQGVKDLLDSVYQTGKPFVANELAVNLLRDNKLETLYINFVYEPLYDLDGNINGLITIGTDVTEQLKAREIIQQNAAELRSVNKKLAGSNTELTVINKQLERAYEQASLSKLAAQLGTFDMDLERNTLEWDDRCRELFGIDHQETVSYEKDFVTGLHPDDRDRVVKAIDNVFIKEKSDGDYDIEYRTIGVKDQKIRWVRAKGKAYFDQHDKPVRFLGSVLDITEQKMDELRKNDFIGMVSHELKTPLTSLSAIVQVLQRKFKSNEDPFIAGALDKANLQVKRMSNMINGFLNISRLESGKITINKHPFIMGDLIREMIEEINLTGISHIIAIDLCDKVVVKADRDKIGSVITNLFSNAVKYSPKASHVRVGCKLMGKKVQVSVTDEGLGIKPQDAAKIFERYYRVESSNTHNISGFGIGLYLSAEIIERHDGEIGVESEYGKGSTFYFRLPLG